MNTLMTVNTNKRAIRLIFVVALFLVLATSLTVMIRYRASLLIAVERHRTLADKINQMRSLISDERAVISRFRNILPAGFASNSPELFILTKLDEIKNQMAAEDMTITPIQNQDGTRTSHFTIKIIHPDYNRIINLLGRIETEVFPFVSITSLEIENQPTETSSGLIMKVEGDVIMPGNPATEQLDASAQTVKPAAGGTKP